MDRSLPANILCPMVTAFKENGDLDPEAIARQTLRLARAGVGIALMGTNGEMGHLSAEERAEVVRTARSALDENGFKETALVAGCGDNSTRLTIQRCKEAAAAGADYALVIFPGYFAFAVGRPAIKQFFTEVFDASPIPVWIYNFPGVNSVDLDSDMINELAEHPNCGGVKLTCANLAKGYRIALHTKSDAYKARHPSPFLLFAGFSDYLTGAMISRHDGAITGTANVYPRLIRALYDATTAALKDPTIWPVALKLQDIVTAADSVVIKGGIPGTKAILNRIEADLGGFPRGPLLESNAGAALLAEPALAKAYEAEARLRAGGAVFVTE